MAVGNDKADVIINIRIALLEAKKSLAKTKKLMGDFSKTGVAGMKQVALAEQRVSAASKKLGAELKDGKMEFQGWALSIMFFGMAMQRVFMGMWRNSSKVFVDVMASTEDATNGFTVLQSSVKFLQFSIGAALEPVAMWLAPIIMNIAEWVTRNEGLVKTITVLGIVLGGIFTAGGILTLAAAGFADFAIKMGWATLSAKGAIIATDGLAASIKALRIAAGIGILVVVGMRIFGSDKKPTTRDWLTNLGMAAGGGWMLGGPWGALAAALITLVVMVSKEDARKALQQVKFIKDTTEKLMRGEALNIDEAIAIQWQGTIVPQYVQNEQDRQLEDSLVKAGIGSQAAYDLKYGAPITEFNQGDINIVLDSEIIFSKPMTELNTTADRFS